MKKKQVFIFMSVIAIAIVFAIYKFDKPEKTTAKVLVEKCENGQVPTPEHPCIPRPIPNG